MSIKLYQGGDTMAQTGWDIEYSTNYMKEVDIFTANNIRWSFVKTINGVRTYKYKKSKKLFELLAELYKDIN
jgi:hypothetical protein